MGRPGPGPAGGRMTEESRNVAGPRSPSSGYRPHQTTWLLLIYDAAAVSLAVCAPLILRLDTLDPNVSILPFLPAALTPIVVRPLVLVAFGLYRRGGRHPSPRGVLD